MSDDQEPIVVVQVGNSRITLLGTAHVSRASVEKVRELLATDKFDAIAVELCPSRYNSLIDPDSLARMDLFRVMREKKVLMVVASLALGAFQQRIAEQFDIEPGAEQREAIKAAHDSHRPVLLIDREIGVTLKRVAHNISWWRDSMTKEDFENCNVLFQEEDKEQYIEKLLTKSQIL